MVDEACFTEMNRNNSAIGENIYLALGVVQGQLRVMLGVHCGLVGGEFFVGGRFIVVFSKLGA